MAFGAHRRSMPARDGQVSETGEVASTVVPDDYTQTYEGYSPQRYIRPTVGYEHAVDPGDNQQHKIGHEPGDGTVPNNTDRGAYGHGRIVDSHVAPKDHSRHELSDNVAQVMPEQVDNTVFHLQPMPVVIVDKDESPRIIQTINHYRITSPVGQAGGGQPTQNGLTPIRVLGKDPHRTRAVLTVVATSGTPTPVILQSEQSLPAYGFPIASTTAQPMPIFTTEEVWVSGSLANDDFIVVVLVERSVNADPRG